MLKVELTTTTRKTYLLTGTETQSPVLAPEAALVELIGKAVRTDLAVPARSGVLLGRTRFTELKTSLEFYLHADDGETMEQVYREFRQGWSLEKPCTLAVTADHVEGTFYLDLWLDQPLPGVSVDMRRRTSTVLPVQVVNPTGLFRSETQTGTGLVTVTNWGDGVIYPKIRNIGPGGIVTSPSGATWTLPPSTQAQTTLDLDPRELRQPGVFPEGVEPGDRQSWSLPQGATLEWSVLIADPWA